MRRNIFHENILLNEGSIITKSKQKKYGHFENVFVSKK